MHWNTLVRRKERMRFELNVSQVMDKYNQAGLLYKQHRFTEGLALASEALQELEECSVVTPQYCLVS